MERLAWLFALCVAVAILACAAPDEQVPLREVVCEHAAIVSQAVPVNEDRMGEGIAGFTAHYLDDPTIGAEGDSRVAATVAAEAACRASGGG